MLLRNGLRVVILSATLLSSACGPGQERVKTINPPPSPAQFSPLPTQHPSTTPTPTFTPLPSPAYSATPSLSVTPNLVLSLTPPPTVTLLPPRTAKQKYPSCHPLEVPFKPYSFPDLPPSPVEGLAIRSLAAARGLWFGTAADGGALFNAPYAQLISSQFNLLTAENAMKWSRVQPEKDIFDFREADALVLFAEQHQMAMRGHTLVWHHQLPDWITQGTYSRERWIQILCRHVKTVVHHFQGRILAWDVVNEAMANEGVLYDNLWLEKIGPDYIPMAFQWAHEADPQAILVYNDHSAEGMNPKSQAIYLLVKDLIERGIPIHAVGLQMHINLFNSPSVSELAANIQRLAALGLQAHITEMDLRIQYGGQTMEEKLALQAKIYQDILSTCLQQPNCRFFSTWGASDQYSWIPGITGHPDAPLLFDEAGKPKPAFYAVLDALSQP